MAADPAQLEALKLIGDWCKWYSAIATGAITAIGAFVFKVTVIDLWIQIVVALAVICFLLAVFMAGFMLSSLPEAVQQIQPQKLVWDRKADILGRKNLRFGAMIVYIMGFFFAGILAFAMSIIGVMFTASR